jgi:hypothetical protein
MDTCCADLAGVEWLETLAGLKPPLAGKQFS